MNKNFLSASALLFLFLGEGIGQASYVQLTSVTQLSPTDALATYAQPDLTVLGSPFSEVSAGNLVTFATAGNTPFVVQHQGISFFGDFSSGTAVLFNGGNGPDTIIFASPITQFGITAESDVIALHTYTVTLLTGSTADYMYTFSDDGYSTFFLGAQGAAGSVFNRVTVSSDDSSFAIGPLSVSVSSTSTPEPASWLLFATGITLVGLSSVRICKRG